jgi:cell division cycle 14
MEAALASPLHKVFDRVHLVLTDKPDAGYASDLEEAGVRYFRIDGKITYNAFHDDFGPMNMGSVFHFCKLIGKLLENDSIRKLAMVCDTDRRSVTNAVFLLGAYLILDEQYDVNCVMTCFNKEVMDMVLPYRDVSPGPQNFNLFVTDCWRGLLRGRQLKWVDFGPNGFDADEYFLYDDPLNADLHEVVPDKFVAMRGPIKLKNGSTYRNNMDADGGFSHRDFDPEHYADILPLFDVQCIVRLNAPQYPVDALAPAGIAVADLFFEDCTTPPVEVVARFLAREYKHEFKEFVLAVFLYFNIKLWSLGIFD